MTVQFVALGLGLAFALISARWSMELGFSQFGQLLWGVAGFFAGPLVLLVLYVRLLRAGPDRGNIWFRSVRAPAAGSGRAASYPPTAPRNEGFPGAYI
jgi:hypothetical protein